MNEMVNKCYSCDFHRQECTFTLSGGANPSTNPSAADVQTKKRKLDEAIAGDLEPARYGTQTHIHLVGASAPWRRGAASVLLLPG